MLKFIRTKDHHIRDSLHCGGQGVSDQKKIMINNFIPLNKV